MIQTDVLIIGGGIVGASIAWHLAHETPRHALLLERGNLTCGTTWHAAGLVAELRASANLIRMARYSGRLYEQLERDGFATGYRRVGALTLAASAARAEELQRQGAMARQNGLHCDWLSGRAVAERWPHIDCTDVVGALYLPNDGQTNPVDTTQALARSARAAGADIREGVSVEKLWVEQGKVIGAHTSLGAVRAETVVIAAGLWSRELALSIGADVPVHAAEHFYAVTEPLSDRVPELIVRDPDLGVYIKPDAGRLLIGCFERDAKPLDARSLPDDFAFDELPFDLDHFAPYLEAAMGRMPVIERTGIRTWFNGPEGFTPDGRYMLGPVPGVANLYAACGFNSIGIQSAGGVGQVMAQWIHHGHPPLDLWEVDIRRFARLHNADEFLRERTAESLGLLYDMHWPFRQYESARGQRRSPLHDALAAQGACFGELFGWERPNWYGEPGTQPVYEYAFGAQNWFANQGAECNAVRERVALFDQSSFAKYEISGVDACRFLNRLCTADMDTATGRVTYTQWLNERGGIEADVTVTRLGETRYLVVSGCACETRDLHWLNSHAQDWRIEIRNVTEQLAVIGVMGPLARAHLQPLTDSALGAEAFPFGTSQLIRIAGKPVRASRITYVGELGWELYVPVDDALSVYRAITQTPITHAGYHAMDSLRMEKGYRHWGHDITDEDTPLEAGLSFTVAWDKPGGFIGRDALMAQKQSPLTKRLAAFRLRDGQVHLFHNEPVWCNGERVGYLRSAAYCHTFGAAVGLGYIEGPLAGERAQLLAGRYEIEVGERRVAADVSIKPFYDSAGIRVR